MQGMNHIHLSGVVKLPYIKKCTMHSQGGPCKATCNTCFLQVCWPTLQVVTPSVRDVPPPGAGRTGAQVLMSAGAQQLLAEAEADDPAKWHGFMPGDGDGDTMDVGALKGGTPRCAAASRHLPHCAGVPGRGDRMRGGALTQYLQACLGSPSAVQQDREQVCGFLISPESPLENTPVVGFKAGLFCASTT